ncbi:MAG: putative baseplate assembly protein [Anaerolineae bacterium]|nr:putative baseplate assembly protein [Anaerolineae bacterium]
MPLPTPRLDDLHFQKDLVDEARKRIIRYCPEWTDYNLSDPGITLIELFSWMTEMITYRLNRVPELNFIKFMELLGIQMEPASNARTELTFYLSIPLPIDVDDPDNSITAFIPKNTQVATSQTEEKGEIIFTTDTELTITPPKLIHVRRKLYEQEQQDINIDHYQRLKRNIPFEVFNSPPKFEDAFYLGFDKDESLSGRIIQLNLECEGRQAVGIKRDDPPLVWECWVEDSRGSRWEEVPPSTRNKRERDTTGGLNNETGALVLYLPLNAQVGTVHDIEAYWIRCRYEQRRLEQGKYEESPCIRSITAQVLGGTAKATHAVLVEDEELGRSNGDPYQGFHLNHAPVIALDETESVEVEERSSDGKLVYVKWQCVPDFSNSDRYDRHFTLDLRTGEIRFGPAIRQADGSVHQYGRVPEVGRRIRVNKYRYGGGTEGNVPERSIQVLKSAIPYIDRVTNLARAEGGRDAETLEEAKMRVPRELRAQQRAVTAEDYENLAKRASRAVARVKCLTPGKQGTSLPPGMVKLLVVPAAFDAIKVGNLTKLALDEDLQTIIHNYLDKYRLLTTTLRIAEPNYVGVKVEVEIVPEDYLKSSETQLKVIEALENYLTPLTLNGSAGELESSTTHQQYESLEVPGQRREGWPFGQNLYIAEIYALVQHVPGVKHVLEVRLSQRPITPSREQTQQEPGTEGDTNASETQPNVEELKPVTEKMLVISEDTLLCSLRHEVRIVELI